VIVVNMYYFPWFDIDDFGVNRRNWAEKVSSLEYCQLALMLDLARWSPAVE